MFAIRYAEGVAADLAAMRAFEQRQLLDRIERQLSHEPSRETRNKKPLRGLVPPWEHTKPVWELRVGGYRAFYDVDEVAEQVIVRAVRHKPPHKATGEIL